jgi:DNA-binding transcriptional MerR regulator
MQTPTQVAKKANVTAQTIRNYGDTYAALLSPSGTANPRLYTDEDVEILCTIASLRRAGVPHDEIVERIQNQDVPPLIDLAANVPSNEPQEPLKTASNEALATVDVQSMLEAHFEAVERAQRVQVRRALWSHGVAFYLGMVTMGAIFLAVWWLVNG